MGKVRVLAAASLLVVLVAGIPALAGCGGGGKPAKSTPEKSGPGTTGGARLLFFTMDG